MIKYDDKKSCVAVSYNSAIYNDFCRFIKQEHNIDLERIEPDIFLQKNVWPDQYVNLVLQDFDLRKKISNKLDQYSITRFSYVHQSSYFDWDTLHDGVLMYPNCTICPNLNIHKDVVVCPNVMIGHHCDIGQGTYLAPGVLVSGSTTIGRFCNIGIGTVIIDHVVIADNVCTGAGTIIRKDINAPGTYINKNQLERLC